MAKVRMNLADLCEALGVERPNEVRRVVLDIRAGDIPMLYVERIADAEKIMAALTGPSIELRRDDPGARPAAKVEFCNWCPDPPRPDVRFHPDGGPEHREKTEQPRCSAAFFSNALGVDIPCIREVGHGGYHRTDDASGPIEWPS